MGVARVRAPWCDRNPSTAPLHGLVLRRNALAGRAEALEAASAVPELLVRVVLAAPAMARVEADGTEGPAAVHVKAAPVAACHRQAAVVEEEILCPG